MSVSRSNSYKNKPSTAEISQSTNSHDPKSHSNSMKSVSTIFSQHKDRFIIAITLIAIFSSLTLTLGVVFGLLIAKSPCSNSPCQHGGVCFITSVLGSYNCICDSKYAGKNCETLLQQKGHSEGRDLKQ